MEQYVYKKEESTNLVDEGDYEVVIENMKIDVNPNSGKEKLSIMYRIRNDVEQRYKTKCLFENIWPDKENPGMFNVRRINKLLNTQDGLENDQVFEGIDSIIDFLKGKRLIVHVIVEYSEYWQSKVNNITYYAKTKNAPKTLGSIPNSNYVKDAPDSGIVVADDDLPFSI